MKIEGRALSVLGFAGSLLGVLVALSASGAEANPLFSIGGKDFSREDLSPAEQGRLHELDVSRFKTLESYARQRFVDEKSKPYEKLNTSENPFAAEEKWLNKSYDPSSSEIAKALEKFKEEKSLQNLSAEEKNKVMRRYLSQQSRIRLLTEATDKAIEKGDIKLAAQAPSAPVFSIAKGTQAVIGDVGAPVRVVEFTDFQCPYCKKFATVSQDVIRKLGPNLSWEVRHFPLSFHKQARQAAAAVYCASLQGKLVEGKKWAFDAQERLSQEGIFDEMSKALGIPASIFQTCRDSAETQKVIDADMKEGERLGVSGTPSVFVNGRKFEGDVHSFEAWETLIHSLVKEARQAKTL
jgi:protein-disulfide isomerase